MRDAVSSAESWVNRIAPGRRTTRGNRTQRSGAWGVVSAEVSVPSCDGDTVILLFLNGTEMELNWCSGCGKYTNLNGTRLEFSDWNDPDKLPDEYWLTDPTGTTHGYCVFH